MKTLTDIGINKQLVRMKDSLSHATFSENGVLKRVPIFQATVTDNKIRIFVYLDDTVTGKVSNVALVDEDGDTIAVAKREFTKPSNKGIPPKPREAGVAEKGGYRLCQYWKYSTFKRSTPPASAAAR